MSRKGLPLQNITGMALHTAISFFILGVCLLYKIQKNSKLYVWSGVIVACLLCWFLFTWQYFVGSEDRQINQMLKSDAALLSLNLENTVQRRQESINQLANRLSWLHSLNYSILKNEISAYFSWYPNLMFMNLKLENGETYSFFQTSQDEKSADYFVSVCNKKSSFNKYQSLVCMHSSNQKLLAVFDLRHDINAIVSNPNYDQHAVEIKLDDASLFFSSSNHLPGMENWTQKKQFIFQSSIWKISVGLNQTQLQFIRKSFPTVYLLLGAIVSILLLFVFYYLHMIVLKNKKLHKNEKVLQDLASKDSLTGVLNRKSLVELLPKLLRRSAVDKLHVAILYIDLDDFKVINDTYGHNVGDQVLVYSAETILKKVRYNDFLARVGGDEFVLVLSDEHVDYHKASRVAKKIISAFQKTIVINKLEISQTISIGIAISNFGEDTVNNLLQQADIAMYASKKKGKNNLSFYNEEIEMKLLREQRLDIALRKCIDDFDGFHMCYQPQFLLKNNKLTGVEALIRTTLPEFEGVSPEELIYIAEKNQVITSLGMWIIERSMSDWLAVKSQCDFFDASLSINLSPVQFAEKNFAKNVLSIIDKNQFPKNKLVFEVTETSMIENMKTCLPQLMSLKQHGVRFAIDDFGKGYSSISYLLNIPADYVKIDKEFVMHLNDKNKIIVSAIVALTSKLKMKSIAEGVEKKEHVDYLNSISCDKGQGYYFSKPLDLQSLIRLIQAI